MDVRRLRALAGVLVLVSGMLVPRVAMGASPPGPVQNLAATAQWESDGYSVHVTWDPPATGTADAYQVWIISGWGEASALVQGRTDWTFRKLMPNTKYCLKVIPNAGPPSFLSGPESTVCVTTGPDGNDQGDSSLGQVRNLRAWTELTTASPHNYILRLAWDPPAAGPPAGYAVFDARGEKLDEWQPGTWTTWRWLAAAPGYTYCLTVRPVGSDGKYGPGSEVCHTVGSDVAPRPEQPPAPLNLRVYPYSWEADKYGIRFEWDLPLPPAEWHEYGLNIYLDGQKQLGIQAREEPAGFSDLQPGRLYCVTLSLRWPLYKDPWYESQGVTGCSVTGLGTGLPVESHVNGGGYPVLTWSGEGGPSDALLIIERSTDGDNWQQVGAMPWGSGWSFTDTSAQPGVEYEYRVYWTRPDGSRSAYGATTVTAGFSGAPLAGGTLGPVQGVTGEGTPDAYRLVWQPGPWAGYTVWRSDDGGGTWYVVGSAPAGSTGWTDYTGNVGPDTQYLVVGHDGAGNYSGSGSPVLAFPGSGGPGAGGGSSPLDGGTLGPVQGVTGGGAPDAYWLAWNPGPFAGYTVWRSDDGGDTWYPVASVPGTATGWTDYTGNVGPDTRYLVIGHDGSGNYSGSGTPVVADPGSGSASPPPGDPSGPPAPSVWALCADRGAVLRWSPVAGATAWRVYRSLDDGRTWTLVQELPGQAAGWIDYLLANDAPYYYMVTYLDADGRESQAGGPVLVVPCDGDAGSGGADGWPPPPGTPLPPPPQLPTMPGWQPPPVPPLELVTPSRPEPTGRTVPPVPQLPIPPDVPAPPALPLPPEPADLFDPEAGLDVVRAPDAPPGLDQPMGGPDSPPGLDAPLGAPDAPPGLDQAMGGPDAPPALDAPLGAPDAPAGLDKPMGGPDAPPGMDAPLGAPDAPPGLDQPMGGPDAPPGLDAPRGPDAPMAPDAPRQVDPPVPLDAPLTPDSPLLPDPPLGP